MGCLPRAKEVPDVCRELQVSEQTYYRWRNQFGGLKANDAERLKDLERENATLKRLLADAEMEKAALKLKMTCDRDPLSSDAR
jgi:putative transposase